MSEITKITVIGAGLMGHGIALSAAHFGNYQVELWDNDQEQLKKGTEAISNWLRDSVKKGNIMEESMYKTLEKVSEGSSLQEVISEANFVIEAIVEDKEKKKKFFRDISKFASNDTIITSNTSSFRISELAAAYAYPENFCGMHFFNPPQVMKLVEIAKGNQTSESTLEKVLQFAQKLGKETILLKKDSPGLIVNRILLPALMEAIKIYSAGIAEKEDIDKAIKLGLNWPMGPLTLIDYIGIDTVSAIGETLEKEIDDNFKPSQTLKILKDEGKLGKKTGTGFYNWNEFAKKTQY